MVYWRSFLSSNSGQGGRNIVLCEQVRELCTGALLATRSQLSPPSDSEECEANSEQLATTLILPRAERFDQCIGYLPGYRELYYGGLGHNVYHCANSFQERPFLDDLAKRASVGTKLLLVTEHLTAGDRQHYHVLHECSYGARTRCRCCERGPMATFRDHGCVRSRVGKLDAYIANDDFERIRRTIVYMAKGPGDRKVIFLYNTVQLGQPPLPTPR